MVRNVLLVDDDLEMLGLLQEGLAGHADAFAVLTAGDGAEALECLRHHNVSLVVTDLKMPHMDGFELLAAILEGYPDIPVIVMSGFSAPGLESTARRGGAVGYIAKPFSIDALALKILTMLRRAAEGGTLHNVSNPSKDRPLHLYTIYSPPQHPDGTIHRTRAEALAAEHH